MMKKCAYVIVLTSIMIYCTFFIIDPQIKKKTDLYQQDVTLSGEGCLILNYHRLRLSDPLIKFLDKWTMFYSKDAELLLYTVYEDEFKEQIKYLINKGFHFITPDKLNQFVRHEKTLPQKCALVTFDDVDISIYKNAYPFLLEKDIPFTLFIITGEVSNPDFEGLELVTWDQIREMKRSGLVTIGTHTHHMHGLDKKGAPPFLTQNRIHNFVQDTKLTIKTVEEKLGFMPIYYAYPYGFGMPQTDDILLESGYELVFTLSPGIVKQGDPSFFIKRVLISRYSWPKVVEWVQLME